MREKTELLPEKTFEVSLPDIFYVKLHNFPELCNWQVLNGKTHETSELFLFHIELWAENKSPLYRHTLFAKLDISLEKKLYIS